MVNRIFEKLFAKSSAEEDAATSSYSLQSGDPFPFDKLSIQEAPQTETLICFVSLSCMICIDLLPHLNELVARCSSPFILITDGTTEENVEIAAYHRFPFPVYSYTDDLADVKVPHTPYLYVTSNGRVIKSGDVEAIEDFWTILQQPSRR